MPLKNAIKKFGGQFADKEPLVDLHHVVKTYESRPDPSLHYKNLQSGGLEMIQRHIGG